MTDAPLPWFGFKAWSIRELGRPLYRIPVDPGWGCPHRAPGEAGEGCGFCGVDSGRARQLGDQHETVADQAEQAIRFSRERYGVGGLQLYVQAYTATFTTADRLRELVEPVLAAHSFDSLSLGTRPDCLPPRILDLLREWSERMDVWVELGVQSCHNPTLESMNRRHSWEDTCRAVTQLKAAGCRVCAHLLFGWPGEMADDMFETVDQTVELGVDGLKLHNLHVVRSSPLGTRWERQPFPVLEESAWLELVMQVLRRIPADLPIFRLMTDTPPEERLAPFAQYPKGVFLRELEKGMRARGWCQGDRVPMMKTGITPETDPVPPVR